MPRISAWLRRSIPKDQSMLPSQSWVRDRAKAKLRKVDRSSEDRADFCSRTSKPSEWIELLSLRLTLSNDKSPYLASAMSAMSSNSKSSRNGWRCYTGSLPDYPTSRLFSSWGVMPSKPSSESSELPTGADQLSKEPSSPETDWELMLSQLTLHMQCGNQS